MNKIKHLPKTLPSRDSEFKVKVVGSLTKEAYEGEFSCRIPRNREQAMIAKEIAFLNAGFDSTLDKGIKNLHRMVAYCKHTIQKAPEWFLESDYGYDLYDINVVEEVYHEILKLEEKWLGNVWGSDEEEKDGDEQES